jgi:hypothetical protein
LECNSIDKIKFKNRKKITFRKKRTKLFKQIRTKYKFLNLRENRM